MIQLAYIITSILCIVIGAYAIVLLHQLRNKYKHEYLNSLFYYQLLVAIFGVYGILGSLLIREILPKFGLPDYGIEAISHFIPFLGLPFLIAGWFMFLKMSIEITSKKSPQLLAILFFVLSTSLFLLFGLYLLGLSDTEMSSWNVVRSRIFVGFGLSSLTIEFIVALLLFFSTLTMKDKLRSMLLLKVALIVGGVGVLKLLTIYFYDLHFSFGLYYLVIYFSGLMPVILLVSSYLSKVESTTLIHTGSDTLFTTYNITPREKEIILEICKGKTNKQIAESLFITLQTVKDHTHNIFQKTEVKNRVQLSTMFSSKV